MAKWEYCWRCKTEVPLLDEQEWQYVYPELREGLHQIQVHRRFHGVSLTQAKNSVYGDGVVHRYHELTGFKAKDAEAVWHHRLVRFGSPCTSCGRLLRTPRAKFCAECGTRAGS